MFFPLLLVAGFSASAQDSLAVKVEQVEQDSLIRHLVKIDKIFVKGNKKTKEFIIKRELSIEEGDLVAIEELNQILEKDRQRVYNTRLFVKVEANVIKLSDRLVDIVIDVSERWYILPLPIFKLADRNFNDWWINQERDISRVNVGVKFNHYNFRGRSERLSLLAQFGYTQAFKFGYHIPYIDKTRKNGAGVSFLYTQNNNISINTLEHKRVFLGSEDPLREIYLGKFMFTRRASFYNTHTAELSFLSTVVKDTVLRRNPDYFPVNQKSLRYFSLSYSFNRDLRNNVSYPLGGFKVNAYARKTGLGIFNDINQFDIGALYAHYFKLPARLYYSNIFVGRLSAPMIQPYYLLTGIGYSESSISGYELYVIEGQHHLINKSTLKFQLVKGDFSLGRAMPFDQFRYVPIALYPKVYFDIGYVVSPHVYHTNNFLVNKPIWGAGFGLDVVSFYDFVMRLEYSYNSLGDKGFFLNFTSGI